MNLDSDLRAKLAELPTGNVADNNGSVPHQGVMDSDIKPLDPTCHMLGRAVTVQGFPDDNLAVHQGINAAGEGEVLVIDLGGYTEGGHFGDICALACQMRGIVGVVIDGAVRDAQDIIELGLPVFSRGLSPAGTTKSCLGKVNVPIACGGITVRPGDVVLGDCDGVVVVPKEREDEVFAAAQAKFEHEVEYVEQLKAGANTLEMYGFDKIIEHLQAM